MASRARRVYLHIGLPKSGTTYLQEKLWLNRHALRGLGVLYPGGDKRAHLHASWDLMGRPRHAGDWTRLVEAAREDDGDVVISREQLCVVDAAGISRAMRSLSWAETHVVCTARDLSRLIPGMWQEMVKNRRQTSYAEWTAMLRATRPGDELHWYTAPHEVLRRWGRELPPRRVHVVTVPRSAAQSDLLWRRFAEAVGIDPAAKLAEPKASNPSMGVVETNLLRRFNAATPEFGWDVYERRVRDDLVANVLARRSGAVALSVPEQDRAAVREWSKNFVRELRAGGYHLLGDLDELLADDQPGETRHPDEVADAELLDAAIHTVSRLVRRVDRLTTGSDAGRRGARPPSAVHELRRTLGYLADRDHPQLAWLRRTYRKLATPRRTNTKS